MKIFYKYHKNKTETIKTTQEWHSNRAIFHNKPNCRQNKWPHSQHVRICRTALKWFTSFLHSWGQSLALGERASTCTLRCVPKGAILSTILFNHIATFSPQYYSIYSHIQEPYQTVIYSTTSMHLSVELVPGIFLKETWSYGNVDGYHNFFFLLERKATLLQAWASVSIVGVQVVVGLCWVYVQWSGSDQLFSLVKLGGDCPLCPPKTLCWRSYDFHEM